LRVDAVLGLSVTPTAVGLVVVDGPEADGPPTDREMFEIASSTVQTPEQATAAVVRTEAIAATRGYRLHAIGVIWSDDADAEASLLLRSLSDSGFDNVVPVQLPEATEALARGIAEVIGYQATAVCLLEPHIAIALIVNAQDGAVQTFVNRGIDSGEALVGWLSAVFTRADWQPDALVVVGSGGEFDAVTPQLEDALSVPVHTPPKPNWRWHAVRPSRRRRPPSSPTPMCARRSATPPGDGVSPSWGPSPCSSPGW
jgi:hypothetical protein